jgi:hypothetical protein
MDDTINRLKDETVNRLKEEMVQAIAAAVSSDPNVEACRAKARAAGYEIHLSLEAELGFASRGKSTALVRARRPGSSWTRRAREISANDRLFLKSLRIAPDEIPEVKG